MSVTPYAPDEHYAAGEFQNLGRDNEGLPTWTAADRSVADTDVVLWYTLGITHIPPPEDWPYMPAHRGGFRLVPTSFFARNPTLDVPATRPCHATVTSQSTRAVGRLRRRA
jgi:primary-amine oxidase